MPSPANSLAEERDRAAKLRQDKIKEQLSRRLDEKDLNREAAEKIADKAAEMMSEAIEGQVGDEIDRQAEDLSDQATDEMTDETTRAGERRRRRLQSVAIDRRPGRVPRPPQYEQADQMDRGAPEQVPAQTQPGATGLPTSKATGQSQGQKRNQDDNVIPFPKKRTPRTDVGQEKTVGNGKSEMGKEERDQEENVSNGEDKVTEKKGGKSVNEKPENPDSQQGNITETQADEKKSPSQQKKTDENNPSGKKDIEESQKQAEAPNKDTAKIPPDDKTNQPAQTAE